jgi:dTDP-4-dehydrorhamnose 3,5-epimerase
MKFISTNIAGVFIIEQERVLDARGFFARTYALEEFARQGIDFQPIQESVSFNSKRATLRGIHFQKSPDEEQKLVRATQGKIQDVALDLRKNSKTYLQSFATELSAENGKALFLPRGIAHGFLTLSDDTEVLYLIDTPYRMESSSGVCWNDPAFNINWPFTPKIISEKDKSWPLYAK